MAARLRRSDCTDAGMTRRRRGKGFEYLDETGERIDDTEVVERIAELRIPPAWRDVWICPHPLGHIQATGIDAAGRKQYLYHQRWRERQSLEKPLHPERSPLHPERSEGSTNATVDPSARKLASG